MNFQNLIADANKGKNRFVLFSIHDLTSGISYWTNPIQNHFAFRLEYTFNEVDFEKIDQVSDIYTYEVSLRAKDVWNLTGIYGPSPSLTRILLIPAEPVQKTDQNSVLMEISASTIQNALQSLSAEQEEIYANYIELKKSQTEDLLQNMRKAGFNI